MSSSRSIPVVADLYNRIYRNSLTEESSYVEAPPSSAGWKTPLYPHQQATLSKMEHFETHLRDGIPMNEQTTFYSKYAILGDKSGSGKTITVLAHIARMKQLVYAPNKHLHPCSTPACFSITEEFDRPHTYYSSLIVVPHTLFTQWAEEIKTHTTYRSLLLKTSRELQRDTLFTELETADCVLISNTLYPEFQRILYTRDPDVQWRRIFFDEADTLRISSSCIQPNARIVWFLSNTYLNLLLSNTYLYTHQMRSLTRETIDSFCEEFRTLIESHLAGRTHSTSAYFRTQSQIYFQPYICSVHPCRGELVIRCSPSFLESSMKLPTLLEQSIQCQAPILSYLQYQIPPQIFRDLEEGNISNVLQELRIQQYTPSTLLETLQEKYRAQHSIDRLTEEIVCRVKESVETTSKEPCAICYDSYRFPLWTPCCTRSFCASCILQSLTLSPDSTCPWCRCVVDPSTLSYVDSSNILTRSIPRYPTKLEAFLQVLESNPTGKFLLFSRYEGIFYKLRNALLHSSHPFRLRTAALNGTKYAIQTALREFEQGTTQILFLSSLVKARGLNLLPTSHIVLFHQITESEKKQLTGLAYRIGRKEPLTTIQLVHENE